MSQILARLTERGVDLSKVILDGGTGISEVTKEEIMACLADVSPGAAYYAHYWHMGQEPFRSHLKNEIRLILAGVWVDRGWEIRKPGILTGMAELGVMELSPQWRRCPQCKGRKGRTNAIKTPEGYRSEWKNCWKCGGSGERKIKDRERAHIVGVNYHQWLKVYLKRHHQYVRPLPDKWDAEIRAALRQFRKNTKSSGLWG